jgi:hypothetical protein
MDLARQQFEANVTECADAREILADIQDGYERGHRLSTRKFLATRALAFGCLPPYGHYNRHSPDEPVLSRQLGPFQLFRQG